MLRIYAPLLFSAAFAIFFLTITFLFRSRRPQRQRSTWTRRVRLARLLIAAAAGLYLITRNLDNLSANIGP